MQNVFAFHAVASNGSIERGTLDAESANEARDTLTGRGLLVVSLESKGPRRERREPVSAADLALGLRILANLLESGLPVTRALHAFDDLAPRSWRGALPAIRQRVREGKSLAAAMAEAPLQIPALVIAVPRITRNVDSGQVTVITDPAAIARDPSAGGLRRLP